MLRSLLLATAMGLGLAGAAAASPNLVVNGSFEIPTPGNGFSGWTIGGIETQGFPPAAIFYGAAQPYPQGAFGEAVPVPNVPTFSPDVPGARGAYFVSDFAQGQSLFQTIFLTPGVYTIGFSAYAPANGFANAGDALFQATIAGVVLANYFVSSGPATSWVHATGVANIASAGNYLVEFLFSTNLFPSKDIVIDQVYVIAGNPGGGDPTGVAAPAALGLFGLGLLGLAALRRRG